MKKYISLAILIAPFFASAQEIKIKGSDTMYPFVKTISELFVEYYPSYTTSVEGGGSGSGIAALCDKKVELAIASRGIKDKEVKVLADKQITHTEVIVGYDALSLIVHPDNPVKQLTIDQLHDVFTGKIKNWKELGGKDVEIKVLTRDTHSGTYDFVKSKILKGDAYAAHDEYLETNEDMVKEVKSNENAIGYCGLAYLKEGIKPLLISEDGVTYTKPSYHNASEHLYPMSRPLYYYYDSNSEVTLSEFIDFTLSAAGQEMVYVEGYVPLHDEVLQEAMNLDLELESLFDY